MDINDFTNAILRVMDSNGSIKGTAFLVAPDLAVTCAHVIEAAGAGVGDKVNVAFKGKNDLIAAIIVPEWLNRTQDVAYLQLKISLPAGVEPLPLGSAHAS